MDIEQLKLILQTVEATTGNAKDVAVFWLALESGKVILDYAATGAGIFAVFKIAKLIINAVTNDSLEKVLRDIIIPDQAGTSVSSFERRRVIETFKRGLLDK